MLFRKLTRSIAARAAAVAVAIVASVIVNPSSLTGVVFAQMLAQSRPNQRVEGHVPENWRPRTGTIITGADADKAKAAAVAKYQDGTVNRVLKLSDGSYAVHMIKIRWPHHVFVRNKFEVIGAIDQTLFPALNDSRPLRPLSDEFEVSGAGSSVYL